MSTVIDYGVRKDRKTYRVHATCRNCASRVIVRLAFGQPKWDPGRGPLCPRCGCCSLTPGAIVGVEA